MNQVKYNDKLIYDFIMDACDPGTPENPNPNYLENTVFLLYGDHGNNLYKGAYESLYGRDLTDLEYRKILLNIPIIIYDPSDSIYESLNPSEIDSILSQTKSNTDIFRTIINLFGLETNSDYFGVNMFSGEPTFTYCPKNLDIITDEFMFCKKNEQYMVYGDDPLNEALIEHILDFRKKHDSYIMTLVYTSDRK